MRNVCLVLLPPDDLKRTRDPNVYLYTKPNGEINGVATEAPEALLKFEYIDRALRDTLVRCMAYDYGDIPPLEEVLAEAEHYVAHRGPDHDPALMARMGVSEKHEDVLDFVMEFIHQPPLSELRGRREHPPSPF
jgi:hypothetical protein